MSGSTRAFPLAWSLFLLFFVPLPGKAQEGCPQLSNPLTAEGWAAYQANDLRLAEERFTQALGPCPLHLGARTGLAYVALREGQDEEAAFRFRILFEVAPESVDVLVGLGILAWREGKLEEAGGYFSRVLELDPENETAEDYIQRLPPEEEPVTVLTDQPPPAQEDPRLKHQRAGEAWDRGDTETAVRLYRELLAVNSSDGLALNRLALISGWAGDYPKALGLFDRLLELEPTNFDAAAGRARVLAWQGETGEALEALDRILEADPENLQALEAQAQILSWVGEHSASLSSYQELLGISDDPTGILLAQARVLGRAARMEEARAAYDSVLARDPENLEAQIGLARTLTWSGSLPEGEASWRAALAGAPDDPAARAGLAHNLRWQGRNEAAREVLDGAGPGQEDHPELVGQRSWVDAALAPRAWVTVSREGDSEDNSMTTAQFRGRRSPFPNLNVYGAVYVRDLKQTQIGWDRSSWGANLDASYQLEPGWIVTAGAGGTRTDGSGTSSFASLRAGVTTPARNRVGGSIRLSRYPRDVTAQLVERGVRVSAVDLSGRWTLSPGWQVTGAVGAGSYRGEEKNQRVHFNLQVSRGMRGGWTLGLVHRYFGFDEDLDEFYFDPDYFGLTEVMAKGGWEKGPWGFLVEFSPGAQKIRSEGEYEAALRTSARVSFRVAPGREVSLSGGYSSAGLQSFNTGASDYRYRALVLGGSWVF
jgi:tetratricopeptide (TPR) repeat protein